MNLIIASKLQSPRNRGCMRIFRVKTLTSIQIRNTHNSEFQINLARQKFCGVSNFVSLVELFENDVVHSAEFLLIDGGIQTKNKHQNLTLMIDYIPLRHECVIAIIFTPEQVRGKSVRTAYSPWM